MRKPIWQLLEGYIASPKAAILSSTNSASSF